MKRIVILSATRAEYGLLKPVILKLLQNNEFAVHLAVTGMHLSPEYGMTVREIEDDNIPIDKRIEIMMGSDTPVAVSKSMGLAIISFSEYFDECKPDALVVLGDRYETLAVCCAAMNAKIPIFHLHGGEATEGLVDEAIRHSITKMSYLHFTSTEAYRNRVIQLGESPERVYNVGAMGVENALHMKLMSLSELKTDLTAMTSEFDKCDFDKPYAIGTFHPVTLEDNTSEQQTRELLSALDKYSEINFIFTKANADADGRKINELMEKYAKDHKNFVLVDSLGTRRYLSAVKCATFVIGNSSSGLIEVPSFHIPTIDIGDRQKGRIAGKTVIHCEPKKRCIVEAINRAMSEEFLEGIKNVTNPYGDGNASDKIIYAIREHMLSKNGIDIKKRFFDMK